jgi:FKBP-type peptidyl-prolyl cis-trans isomerase
LIKRLIIIGLIGFLLIGISCEDDKVVTKKDTVEVDESIQYNRHKDVKEDDLIKRFLKRKNWIDDCKFHTDNFYYVMLKEGEGRSILKTDIVEVLRTVRNLDGTVYYSTDTLKKPHIYSVEEAQPPILTNALMILKEGSKARFFFKSNHLGTGYLGDSKNVVGRQILWYDIEVIQILNR